MSATLNTPPMAANSRGPDPTRFVVEGRASYVFLREARKFGQQRAIADSGTGPAKRSISVILVGPRRAESVAAVEAAIKAAGVKAFGPDPRTWHPRLRGYRQQPLVKNVSSFPGMWDGAPEGTQFIRLATVGDVGIVFRDLAPIPPELLDKTVYPGCWIRASGRAVAYPAGQNYDPGIALWLSNVQWVRHDTRFDNRLSPDQEFAPLDDEDEGEIPIPDDDV